MKSWLTDHEIEKKVAANLRACERFDGFERDEGGWDEIWEGLYALDLRRSVRFAEFPHLLLAACDPQQPIVYAPVFCEFGYTVFDGGPSCTTMPFDPWTGKVLPASVRDAFFAEAEKRLGPGIGLLDDALDTLPEEFRGEAWWISRGL
jgi:hypothetical protein